MRDPRHIYQENLDEVAVRLWARDFDGVCELLLVPTQIVTEDHVTRIDDTDAIRCHVAQHRKTLDDLRADGYHRLCLDAAYTSESGDRIMGRHRTFVLRGGTHVTPPEDREMELVATPGGWKAGCLKVLGTASARAVVDPEAAMAEGSEAGKHR